MDRRLERLTAEGEEAVRGELEHLAVGVLAPPGPARARLERDAGPAEADPHEEPAEKLVPLADLGLEERRDAPREEAEVSRVLQDGHVRDHVDEPVEEPGRRPLEEEACLLVVLTPGVDDLVALLELLEELRDELGRVLEIAVQGDDGVGVGVVDAGQQRGLVPEAS